MRELNYGEIGEIGGGKKIKLHFNFLPTIFTAIGAFVVSGPVGAGVVIGAAIAAQGAGQLVDMYHDQYGNPR